MAKNLKKIDKDQDWPAGRLKKVSDFLPPPDQLVTPDEDVVKVTLGLTKSSLEFFKREAKRNRMKYQKMIRELVDQYAKQF